MTLANICFNPFRISALFAFAALPIVTFAADANDIEAATKIAAETKFKIELATRCGTPISSQPNLRLERFAIALDLKAKSFIPNKLSQADFDNVMTAVSSAETASAISKRAADASAGSGCDQPDTIKYWNFLRESGKLLGK